MKVIIVGAGNVGYTSAEALCKVHDVLVIEKDALKADNAKSTLSVSVLHEDGSNPKVLKSAIERVDAEVILSALPDDAINLFICMMAKRIKASIRTVACLRDPDFEVRTTSEGAEGVDLLISPEFIMAEKINKLATLENAVKYDYIENMEVALVTYRVDRKNDLVGKIVMDLEIPDNCSIVAVYRGDSVILNNESVQIHVDDRIGVLGDIDAIEAFNRMMGVEKDAKEFVILGATISGIAIAKLLSQSGKKRFVKIIDKDESACRNAARALSDVVVVNADIVDPVILKSENVNRADVIISVSPMDERNLLACMAALRFGTNKIITRYSTEEYEEIFKYTGIESIIGYHRVISNEVTKNLIYDESAILMLDNEDEYFFSVTLDKKSMLTGHCMGDVKIPDGVRLVAIRRDNNMIYPKMNTMFLDGDKVLVFTHAVNPIRLTKFLGQETIVEL